MAFETIFGLSILAVSVIVYAVSRIPNNRFKYVDQKVKDRSEAEYVIVLYI